MIRAGLFLFTGLLFLSGCNGDGPTNLVGRSPDGLPTDSLPPPVPPDTTGGDSVPPPPPPPDTVPPPSDTTGPVEPPHIPVHVGIPFGPTQMPIESFSQEYSGTIYPTSHPDRLLPALERARQVNARIMVNLTGNESGFRDQHGFNFDAWKRKVDRYRGIDFSSYVADGTLLGHFIMDEPFDPTNWNGKPVSPAQVEELAKYSKEIWPTLPTIVGNKPDYLKGQRYKYLDGVRFHYNHRYGPIEPFAATQLQHAKAQDLSYITGLNLLNGGSGESKIPGRRQGKFAMSANEIRTWGGIMIADPYVCGFVMYQYDPNYLARPDIKAALEELKKKADAHPKQSCRRR